MYNTLLAPTSKLILPELDLVIFYNSKTLESQIFLKGQDLMGIMANESGENENETESGLYSELYNWFVVLENAEPMPIGFKEMCISFLYGKKEYIKIFELI